MKQTELSRRDFSKLTMAAFSGMVAGTAIGCSRGDADKPAGTTAAPSGGATADTPGETDAATADTDDTAADGDQVTAVSNILQEKHVCRGLNMCNGQGKGGQNACAGQGSCFTAAEHSCHGQNECKGQGGCGENPAQNACSGKGECGVPLSEDAWEKARAAFETAMQAQDKDFAEAPAG